MDLNGALNSAKDAFANNQDKIKNVINENNDKIDSVIDSVAQKAQDIAPDSVSGHIADAAEKGKEALDNFGNNNAADTNL